jgi:hypothetical protein
MPYTHEQIIRRLCDIRDRTLDDWRDSVTVGVEVEQVDKKTGKTKKVRLPRYQKSGAAQYAFSKALEEIIRVEDRHAGHATQTGEIKLIFAMADDDKKEDEG